MVYMFCSGVRTLRHPTSSMHATRVRRLAGVRITFGVTASSGHPVYWQSVEWSFSLLAEREENGVQVNEPGEQIPFNTKWSCDHSPVYNASNTPW